MTLFKSPEQIEAEAKDREEMEKEFEKGREIEFKDSSLKGKIEADYGKMISDLENGRVKPDAYISRENLNFTEGEITDLGESKSFQALYEQKFLLKAAREQATDKWIRMNALEKTIGKSVDPINFERLEKSLPADLMQEYQTRINEEAQNPVEEEPESDDKNIEYQI